MITGPLLDAAPDALVVADSHGIIRVANRLAAEMFGYSIDELVGNEVEMLVPVDVRSTHHADRLAYAEQPTQRPMGVGRRLTAERRDGSRFPVNISLSPIEVRGARYVVAAIRDMSAWFETERELAAARRRRTIAEEHERIARDLHDTVIQRLFAVGLNLQSVAQMTLDQATSERLESAVDDLDTTVREIRSAIFELHSTRAPETSFRVAATGLVAEAARTLGFEPSISFEGPLDRAVEGALADHLLSVEREALANVARHANASAAEVRFALADGWVALSITDNGSGPGDPDSGGHGLRNMRSRAERLGGRFDIAGTEGGGTSVAWSVPVPT